MIDMLYQNGMNSVIIDNSGGGSGGVGEAVMNYLQLTTTTSTANTASSSILSQGIPQPPISMPGNLSLSLIL